METIRLLHSYINEFFFPILQKYNLKNNGDIS